MLENYLKKGMVGLGVSDVCSASRAKMSGWSVAQSKTGKSCSQTKMTFVKLNI